MPQIKLSPFDRPEGVGNYAVPTQDWAEDTFLQAGFKGLVFVRSTGESYTTCFVEAFPATGGFFRGEGDTLEQAELAVWTKYEASVQCGNHEWETRGYRNGAGFCKNCNMFKSGVFDITIVGNPCHVCNTGTNYAYRDSLWYCKQHAPEPYSFN